MKSYILFLIVLASLLVSPSANYCQTISPISIENDSIDIQKVQFINLKTGLSLRTEIDGRLLHINEIYEDTIKVIIPFKNGTKIILDTVETKYFGNCFMNVQYNKNADSTCALIDYSVGDRIILRTFGENCKKEFNRIQINYLFYNYQEITNNQKSKLSTRIELFYKLRNRKVPKEFRHLK